MRILMTNHSLRAPGGTETWTQTMAAELVRRGNDVTIFTLMKGEMATRMPCEVVTKVPREGFDVCLVNHNTCLGMVYPVDGVKVFTSHGPSHGLERAVRGAGVYVAVSEEVRASNAACGFFPEIVRNPIDLEKFRPAAVEGKQARQLLGGGPTVFINCKNTGALAKAKQACEMAGYAYDFIHYTEHPNFDPAPLMPFFDIAITSGRGALEALACGLAVIVFNGRSDGTVTADGWVTPENVEDVASFNFSGRSRGENWGADELANCLRRYEHHDLRGYVRENHNVRTAADRYLELALEPALATQA